MVCFCCGETIRQAKYLIQHNSAHILRNIGTPENNDCKVQLVEKYGSQEGNQLPCVYCLSSDGKCVLQKQLDSTKNNYIAGNGSCFYKKYMKQSIKTCDAREVKKKKGRYDNICTNRPVECRIPGCGYFHFRIYMPLHYRLQHPTETPHPSIILPIREKEVLRDDLDFLQSPNFMKFEKKQHVKKVKGKKKQ